MAAAPDRAFHVFTAGMSRWWLKSHSINKKSPIKDIVIEPKAGGRWYERGEDGSTCDWGRVLSWEPPTRLVLSWEITADWKHDPESQDGSGGALRRRGQELHARRTRAPPPQSLRGAWRRDARHLRLGDGWKGLLAAFAASALAEQGESNP